MSSELEEIEVPEKTSQIGDYSFYHCNNLSKIRINNKNISFGEKGILFYNTSDYSGSGVFQIDLEDEVPENILNNKEIPIDLIISSNNFTQSDLDKYKGYQVKRIIIKDTVTGIPDGIKFVLNAYIEVNLNNLTYVGSSAFKDRTLLLTNDTFIIDKQTINSYAFSGCKGLKKNYY